MQIEQPAQILPHAMDYGSYKLFCPSPSASSLLAEHEKYLAELLAERQKLNPFLLVLPQSYRLLNLEILRITALLETASILEQSGNEHNSPLTGGGLFSSRGAIGTPGRASALRSEAWLSSQGYSPSRTLKKTIRIDIPVDKFPTYNFIGRLLGPGGNSLMQVEASTECRVLIRGRGSIKDPTMEEFMRGKPGYEHLNEPLHILVEAELPVEIVDSHLMHACEVLEELLKPVDESQDFFRKQQLRELALINGTLRDEGLCMSGSLSPFSSSLV